MENNQIESPADFVEMLAATGRTIDDGIKVATEREIAAMTNLSRSRVREYLAGLETVGLLTRIQGSGTVMRIPGAGGSSNLFTLMERSGQLPFEDIEQFREILEIGTLPQLAGKLDEHLVAKLQNTIEEMHQASQDDDPEAGCDADLAFHRLILRQTGNSLLSFVIESLDSALRSHILDRRKRALTAETASNGGKKPSAFLTDSVHDDILEALISGNGARVADAVRLHFDAHRGLTT
ncbi:FadR/GntR family transcriptional regulator [Brevibacterium oceani]|uniref:FadR/GntR family transcriptional regulator n=1 Tax=Brevibacterium oceani TaxID=358099 RepID=UPI001B33C2C1|nr:FCD domain-containing protein [Brevibacterium oceani]